MMKNLFVYLILLSVLLSCNITSHKEKKIKVIVESDITTSSHLTTSFEDKVSKYFQEVKQPVTYNDWTYLFTNKDDFESMDINMDIVKDYNVSFIDPSNFSKFVEGFSEPISNDWFYPPYSGNLNYLINKRFYCPLFYLKIDNAYLLGLLSAYIDDNGIYPHINLRLFNNQGIELGCDKNIYLFLQKSVEGEMHQITGEIINNKLICRSIIRGYYDDINYKDPFEKCSEVTYEIKNTGFNYISEVILYEKKL